MKVHRPKSIPACLIVQNQFSKIRLDVRLVTVFKQKKYKGPPTLAEKALFLHEVSAVLLANNPAFLYI